MVVCPGGIGLEVFDPGADAGIIIENFLDLLMSLAIIFSLQDTLLLRYLQVWLTASMSSTSSN